MTETKPMENVRIAIQKGREREEFMILEVGGNLSPTWDDALEEVIYWETERTEMQEQLEKVSVLVTAIQRISTNDGRGDYGNLHLNEMRDIARDALTYWFLKNLKPNPRISGNGK